MYFPYPVHHRAVVSYPVEALRHRKLKILAYFCFYWKVRNSPLQPGDSTEGAGAQTSLSSHCWGYTCPVFPLPCATVSYFCILCHSLCLFFFLLVQLETVTHTEVVQCLLAASEVRHCVQRKDTCPFPYPTSV